MEGHDFGVNALVFLPGERQALSASVDESVRLWDLESGRPLADLRGHSVPVLAVAVSPARRWHASGGIAGAVNIWKFGARLVAAPLTGPVHPSLGPTHR